VRLPAWLTMLLAAAALCAAAGCASTESDLPWNTPQSWEGSPTIPGFNRY
jgi:ABC-type glycerol-3-phosphate transport system substrate-binding protein